MSIFVGPVLRGILYRTPQTFVHQGTKETAQVLGMMFSSKVTGMQGHDDKLSFCFISV
jgi:hypothetical protein